MITKKYCLTLFGFMVFALISSCSDEDSSGETVLNCDRSLGEIGIATIVGGEKSCAFAELQNYGQVPDQIDQTLYETLTVEFSTPSEKYIVTVSNFTLKQGQDRSFIQSLGLFQTDVSYSASAKSRTFDQPATVVFTEIDRDRNLMSGIISGRIIKDVVEGSAVFGNVEITFDDLAFK